MDISTVSRSFDGNESVKVILQQYLDSFRPRIGRLLQVANTSSQISDLGERRRGVLLGQAILTL
jgi:hypothetical protein